MKKSLGIYGHLRFYLKYLRFSGFSQDTFNIASIFPNIGDVLEFFFFLVWVWFKVSKSYLHISL